MSRSCRTCGVGGGSRRYFYALSLLVGIFLGSPLSGQEAGEEDASLLSLERIFTEDEFKSRDYAGIWLEEGEGYTLLRDAGPDPETEGKEIWRYFPEVEDPTLLVAASDLVPPGETEALAIEGYQFTKDLSLLLVYTNSKRVWRKNSRGDYWLLDRASGELRKLGGEAPPSSLMFAKFSPTGEHVAYLRDGNIYVEDLLDHTIRCLTSRESPTIINGRGDWVYEEELQVRDGFRWSPDGKFIAYWQLDESGVREQTLVDHVSGLYPKLKSFGYPKVGQRNPSCRAGVVSLESGMTNWFQIPGDPRNHYIARLNWTEDSEGVLVQQLNRTQDTNRVLLVKAADGSAREVLTETDEAWVEVHRALHWVQEGRRFTWLSERNGWRQIFLVSRDGTDTTCLTPEEYDVIELLKIDQAERWIYFVASPSDPSSRFLYRVGLDGSGLERLTPPKERRGTHSYRISPDGNHAMLTTSTWDRPPETSLLRLPGHEPVRTLEANEELKEKLNALQPVRTEFFYVDIGAETPLHARCLYPSGFEASQSYPLLIYVYGEPAGQVVKDRWGGKTDLWHRMLAQQGYMVMSIDNRGTRAPRGRDWRRAAYQKIGILAPEDQARAVRKVLEERSYLDPKRVGSWGWSGGGSMSLNAIFKYPDLYAAAIAVASVPNQRYYDTIYQERYMGLPDANVEGYRQGSPINFAHQLEGDLLIVHGAADDNCHYQTFEKLVDVLVQHNKPFTMMTYPRGTHEIKEGKNTRLHLYSLMTRFLHQSLPRQDTAETP